jgi:hypothetical protein
MMDTDINFGFKNHHNPPFWKEKREREKALRRLSSNKSQASEK